MRSCVRNECVKNLIKLKRQEEAMENSLEQFVKNFKAEPEVLRVIKNERSSRILERKKWENSLRTSVLGITNSFKEIKTSMYDLEENKKIDVDDLKKKLTSLVEKIRDFKKECPLEDFVNEELQLNRAIREFSLDIEKFEHRRVSSRGKRNSEIAIADDQGYKGAKDFDALVAKTGHTGNWSEEDHLFFLKVRKSSPNVPAMVTAIRKKCPDLTAERIVNHEAWYKTYLDLREKQKNAIREWRENKILRQEKNYGTVNDENNISLNKYEKNSSTSMESRDSVQKPEKDDYSEKLRNTDSKSFSRNGEETKKKKIKQWREEREIANAFENERLKSEIESRNVWKENRRLAHARKIKSAVVAYKEKKSMNVNSSETDLERNSTNISKMIKFFRLQDEEFLKRKKDLLERKKSLLTKASVQETPVRSNSEQSTLLNPTKVWLQRCNTAEDPDSKIHRISYVKDIPKLRKYARQNQESVRIFWK